MPRKTKAASRKADSGTRWRYWPRLLFLMPFAAMMWVPSYNRLEPALGGVPFFYWYQLGWILLGAGIVALVHVIETRITHATPRSGKGLEPTDVPGDIL